MNRLLSRHEQIYILNRSYRRHGAKEFRHDKTRYLFWTGKEALPPENDIVVVALANEDPNFVCQKSLIEVNNPRNYKYEYRLKEDI